jgi:heat shock protein HslJ
LTRLELKQDSQYFLTTFYLDEDDPTFNEHGKFTWDAGGSVVTLSGMAEGEGPTRFRVEEGQVRQLDMEGKEITGELAANYVLKKKVPTAIENKRWSLVEFKGKPVPLDSAGYFLVFQAGNGNISTKVGCNQMGFGYFLLPDQSLKITPGMSTMMACPENTMESEYAQVLPTLDNYRLSKEGKLSLQKGKEVMAVFQ